MINKQVLKYQNGIYYGSSHKLPPFCMISIPIRAGRTAREPKATSWQVRLVRYDIITLIRGKIIARCVSETSGSGKITIIEISFHVKREHLYPSDIRNGAHLIIRI